MICISCKIDRNSKDYYKSDKCYKCIYNEKTKANRKIKKCRICGKEIARGRWVFCSTTCAEKDSYESWTRNLPSPIQSHKKHPWKGNGFST